MKTKTIQLKPIEILLVEDNPGDVRLTIEAFSECLTPTNIHDVEDGVVALDFLYKKAPYENVPTPDLILLDLNLPKKNGKDVLEVIKSDDFLKSIPVIVLTTSTADFDINKCYDLSANCFISKPIDYESFMEVIKSIERYWLKLTILPSRIT